MTFREAKTKFASYGSTVGAQINFTLARAILSGKWSGTITTLRCAVYDYADVGVTRRQFTLPREAETALGIRFENLNGVGRTGGRPIHNQWYSWMDGRCCGEWSTGIIDMGYVSTFRDIPVNAQLRIRTDYEESGDFAIRGVDASGNTIYSGDEPNVIEGEVLDLAENPATTSATFLAGSTISVVKPAPTNGPVRLYSWDGTTETLLATYGPGESLPKYRRYQVPNGSNFEHVLVKAKRKHVDLVADNDPLIPDNEVALYFGLKAKNFEDKQDDSDRVNEYLGKFYDALNGQLREEQGNAPMTIRLRTGEGFGSIRQRM